MIARILSAASILTLAVGCVASPDKTVSRDNTATPPFLVEGKVVTEADIERSLGVGQRVFILFQEYDTQDGVKNCPVKIRTLDDQCEDKHYQNSDPSVICRVSEDGVADERDKKIVWFGEAPYTVRFEPGINPCKSGWAGSTEKVWHSCHLRKAADLAIEAGKAVYIKYTIQGDAACAPLDPFFIVRR